MPEINHLALGVEDPAASLIFYRSVLGLEGTVLRDGEGFLLTMPSGFVFALLPGFRPEDLGWVHFGFRLPDPAAVAAKRMELAAKGLAEVDWWEQPGLTSLKVEDPDGYIVEFFADDWSPTLGRPADPNI